MYRFNKQKIFKAKIEKVVVKKKSEMLTLLSLFPSPVSPPPLDNSARPFMRIVHSICSITRCTMHLSAQYKKTRAVSSPIQSPPPPPSNRLKSINRSDFQIEILSFLLEFDFCRIFQCLQILQFLKKVSNSYVYNMNYKRSVIFPPTNISHL